MLGGGEERKQHCRKPAIMADAAYIMLTKDSRSYTGHFKIDQDVLFAEGQQDLSRYNYVKGMDKILTQLIIQVRVTNTDKPAM